MNDFLVTPGPEGEIHIRKSEITAVVEVDASEGKNDTIILTRIYFGTGDDDFWNSCESAAEIMAKF